MTLMNGWKKIWIMMNKYDSISIDMVRLNDILKKKYDELPPSYCPEVDNMMRTMTVLIQKAQLLNVKK